MSEAIQRNHQRLRGNSVLGWVGLIFAIVGLFVLPFWLGWIAIVFGFADQFTPNRSYGIAALIIGAIDLIFPLFVLALFM